MKKTSFIVSCCISLVIFVAALNFVRYDILFPAIDIERSASSSDLVGEKSDMPQSENSLTSESTSSESSYSSSSGSSQITSSSAPTPSVQQSQPKEDSKPSSSSVNVTYPLNINTATQEEFATLPGIDEEQARLFVVWRDAGGNYTDIRELIMVKNMDWDKFNKIKDYIYCE